MNEKLICLRNKIRIMDLDAMIVSNPVNIKYLTNIKAEGLLILGRKENHFITDGRYIEDVNNILTIMDGIIVHDYKNLSKEDMENFFLFCENVGFEENYITYATYKEYMYKYKINSLVETENIIEKQRTIKDQEEIGKITKACLLTDKCFEHIIRFIKKGMTEKEIAYEIETFFRKNGADRLAFDTIVASGPNSSKPHAVPTDRRITSGDVITIDMGCVCEEYCSDMTRTIFVDYVDEEVRPIYELVLKNLKQSTEEMREGLVCKNITKMVVSDFELHEYDLAHALGHGVGLEVHEIPVLGTKVETILKPNMVVTSEPGIYIPGKFGIRIEDTVLVGKSVGIHLKKKKRDYVII